MTSSRFISFSLLAFYGISLFTALRRRKSVETDEVDIISQLPDEILGLIISHLNHRDAQSTSLLSKRWRNIYKLASHMEVICFDLLYTKNSPATEHFGSKSGLIMDRLSWVCSHYRIIKSLKLKCCISNAYHFQQCLYSLRHAETLDLCFSCREFESSELSFPLDNLHLLSSLKLLRLSLCYLAPNPNRFQSSSLHTLYLNSVKVLPFALESILSTCVGLHLLSITDCDGPSKITISGSNLRLNSLIIHYCRGVEEIQLCATNLIVLDLKSRETVNLVFDHAPQLETLLSIVEGKTYMPGIFRGLARDLSSLKYLTFVARGYFYQSSVDTRLGAGILFSQLRQLNLFVCCCTSTVDLQSLIPLLQSCPLLHEFCLDVQNLNYYEGAPAIPSSDLVVRKVQISGYSGKKNEIDFALSILRSAACLEQMNIIWTAKFHKSCCGWNTRSRPRWDRQTIQRQLQGQAISYNAHLIIQDWFNY